MKKKKLFKYEKEARKKERHKNSKSYAKKMAKKEYTQKLKEWSRLVKERDNNQCVYCQVEKGLNSHHIIPKQNKELRLDIMNGITLCSKHHKFSFEFSAHQNSFAFINWLIKNRTEQFDYLKEEGQ